MRLPFASANWILMLYFNPRTTCVMRLRYNIQTSLRTRFQSTHHLRDATFHSQPCKFLSFPFQSTHHLRDATGIPSLQHRIAFISIHAPLAWCDGIMPLNVWLFDCISIHAPLAWCDASSVFRPLFDTNFNPRTTCVMRPEESPLIPNPLLISIHAPLAWCDCN